MFSSFVFEVIGEKSIKQQRVTGKVKEGWTELKITKEKIFMECTRDMEDDNEEFNLNLYLYLPKVKHRH